MGARRREDNRLRSEDRAAHEWYRFVLSFPPHLVRDYAARFGLGRRHVVLDPFAGTGTTLVECKKLGIRSVGLEANPMACFAARVKTDWSVGPLALTAAAERIAAGARRRRAGGPPETLPAASQALLLKGSISPLPLAKTLLLRTALAEGDAARERDHLTLALARTAVQASNLRFGPEVGVGPAKADAPVVGTWLANVRAMAADLAALRARARVAAVVHGADAREPLAALGPRSIDAVITSPPYPNEKDYTRATRLESVLLGFVCDRAELRTLKQGLLRSNTRGVYAGDDDDHAVGGHAAIARLAAAIEERRVALGKTSGFERLYARVTRLYFGGMVRHLAALRAVLRPGARLAYVVGDQASYFRVMIRTGQLLAGLAESLGYEVVGLDLFRTRRATASRAELREEVLVLRWPG